MIEIRPVQESDISQILAIYAYYVLETPISFETEVPTREEFLLRVKEIEKNYPFLVFCENKKVQGYAYGARHRARKAYDLSVETSIYLAKEYCGRGGGSLLYQKLLEDLKAQGLAQAFAGTTLPNDASIALHKKLGFHEIGTFKKIGHKFSTWHDVAWYQRDLQK